MKDRKEQARRHAVAREAEKMVAKKVGGQTTNHTAPFDVVDFGMKVAYEVKAMSAFSKDLKIHISDSSMKRKKAFARKYGLKAVLLAVVIYSPHKVKVYSTTLKQSARVKQMKVVAI